MTKEDALTLALEALELLCVKCRSNEWGPDTPRKEILNWMHDHASKAHTAIEEALAHDDEDAIIIQYHEATIKILEKRIEELTAQPEQEPVARVIDNGTPEGSTEWIPFANRVEPLKTGDLLYTTPPQRTWAGLTDEDITEIDQGIYPTWKDEVQAIEARLKELNNG